MVFIFILKIVVLLWKRRLEAAFNNHTVVNRLYMGNRSSSQFYLAFAYIPRSHEIASYVTSSSVRVSTLSQVVQRSLKNFYTFMMRKRKRTRPLTNATHSKQVPLPHVVLSNTRIKQPLLCRTSASSPMLYII